MLAGANQQNGNCASIHDRVVFKQPNLDQRIQYDKYPRKSLLDLFYDNETTLAAVASGQAALRSDFTHASYDAKIRRNAERIQVQLVRDGWACGVPVRITKGLTLDSGSSKLEIAYLLEGLPQDRPLHFVLSKWETLPAASPLAPTTVTSTTSMAIIWDNWAPNLIWASAWAWAFATSGWASTSG